MHAQKLLQEEGLNSTGPENFQAESVGSVELSKQNWIAGTLFISNITNSVL